MAVPNVGGLGSRETRAAQPRPQSPSSPKEVTDGFDELTVTTPADYLTSYDINLRLRGTCPVCRGEDDLAVAWKTRWLYACNSCGAGGHLARLVEATGEPAFLWLDGLVPIAGLAVESRHGVRSTPKVAPPSLGSLAGWQSQLASDPSALDWLHTQRGLSDETIRRARIGYAASGALRPYAHYPAFTLPVVSRAGQVVNLRKRFWPRLPRDRREKQVKYVGLAGAAAALYPAPPGRGVNVLCEGELDALLLQQEFDAAGITARVLTTTCGMEWPRELLPLARHRRFAVIYDADKYDRARRRAADLVEAGAREAWAVDLSRHGLSGKDDLTDWFVNYGRTAEQLRRLIRSAREPWNR